MKVLHAISGISTSLGGPSAVLSGLTRAQVRAGLDVTVVATWVNDRGEADRSALEAAGVRVVQVGPAKDPMSRHPDLARVLDELIRQSDVVHVHAVWEQIQYLAMSIARRRGVPFVFRPCGMLDPWNMSAGWLKKRLYLALRLKRQINRAAAIHFATPGERDAVARLGLKAPALVEPLGIDAAEFKDLPPAGAFRAAHPQIGDRRIVTFLGRLDRGKGLEILIPAFAQVAPPDCVLAIIGPDSLSGYQREVERLIAQHGLGDRAVLTGMLKGRDKLAALVDSYVVCQPSFHENFGMFVVESLACGCPVILSDQVYLHPEVTKAGVGTAVPVAVEAVSKELARWLTDRALRDRHAAGAREFALSRFDWDQIATRWAGHYARFCGAR